MKNFSWAVALIGAGLALAGVNTAKADTVFDLRCGSGCGTTPSVGTLTATTIGNDLDLKISLTAGDLANGGNTTFFFNLGAGVTIASNGFTIQSDTSDQTAGDWTLATTLKTDGLSAGTWTLGFNCNAQHDCGQVFDVLLTGLGSASLQPQSVGGFSVYAGADITCVQEDTCSFPDPAKPGSNFQTGVMGATAAAVPGPILGGGLPGLIAACAGLVAFARRRQLRIA